MNFTPREDFTPRRLEESQEVEPESGVEPAETNLAGNPDLEDAVQSSGDYPTTLESETLPTGPLPAVEPRDEAFQDETLAAPVIAPTPPPAPQSAAEDPKASRSEKQSLRTRWAASRQERASRTSSLRLTRISPWRASVIGLVYGLILACVVEGAVYFAWRAFDAAGVFDKMVSAVAPTGSDSAATIESWLTLEKFLTVGGVFAASLVVIVPMSIFFSILVYNLSARIMGGVRLTLMGDRDRRAKKAKSA